MVECRNHCGRLLDPGQGPLCPYCVDQQKKKSGLWTTIGGGLVLLAAGVVWLVEKMRGHEDNQNT